MAKHREILKIGLAVTVNRRILLVRKRGQSDYILPGGKPEPGETDLDALRREIEEELGCELDANSISFLGTFSDHIAGDLHTRVTVRLYRGALVGEPSPRSEIEELKWLQPTNDTATELAPSLVNHIIPFLSSRGYLSASAIKAHR